MVLAVLFFTIWACMLSVEVKSLPYKPPNIIDLKTKIDAQENIILKFKSEMSKTVDSHTNQLQMISQKVDSNKDLSDSTKALIESVFMQLRMLNKIFLSNTQSIDKLSQKVDSISTQQSHIIDNLKGKMESNKNSIEALKTETKDQKAGQDKEIASLAATTNNKMNELQNNVETKINNVEGKVTTLKNEVAEVKTLSPRILAAKHGLRFLGNGHYESTSKNNGAGYGLSVEQCLVRCKKRRPSNSPAMNGDGIYYYVPQKYCSCTNGESGHRTDSYYTNYLHFRF